MKSYFWPLEQLPGLPKESYQQLSRLGIKTTEHLLKFGNTVEKRQALANDLHIPMRYIQKWLALSDLARVPAVGCQYCGVLLHAGIISVSQLAHCSQGQLYNRIRRLHVQTLTSMHSCPPPDEVALWIQNAKRITPEFN